MVQPIESARFLPIIRDAVAVGILQRPIETPPSSSETVASLGMDTVGSLRSTTAIPPRMNGLFFAETNATSP